MPPLDPARDTAAELRRAARDLLLQEGLSGVSMRRVASACNISATAIYRHYPDKDALISAAVIDGFREFGSYLLDSLKKRTPRTRFRAAGQRYFDFAQDHPRDYQLMFMTNCEELGLKKLDETSQQQIGSTFQLLQDRIVECQQARVIKAGDPRALAAYVWTSVHGLASLLITGNLGASKTEAAALTKQQLDLIQDALST